MFFPRYDYLASYKVSYTHMAKRTPSLLVPVIFIILGLSWLLGNAGVWDCSSIFVNWWPLLFVIGGLLSLQNNPRQYTFPVVLIALGTFLILMNLGYLSGNFWSYFWPVIIIFVGISLLTKPSGRSFRSAKQEDSSNDVNIFAVFGGKERHIHSQRFTSADITALFGGATLDLRDANFSKMSEVNATAIFGGIEILVPKNVSVALNGTPVFGGFDDKTHPDASTENTIKISGTAVFGGVSVAHEKH